MNQVQLTHKEVSNDKSDKEIIIITDSIRTPENVGMLFRISEAFGVKKIILTGDSPNLSNKKVLRTARSTEKELDIQFVANIEEIINTLKTEKYKLIGLEMTSGSKSLHKTDFSSTPMLALFIGAERFGITSTILKQLDTVVHIDLFGKNSSVNVVNALAIALYEITRKS